MKILKYFFWEKCTGVYHNNFEVREESVKQDVSAKHHSHSSIIKVTGWRSKLMLSESAWHKRNACRIWQQPCMDQKLKPR